MFRELIWKIIYGGGVAFDLGKWLVLCLIVFITVNTFFISIFHVNGTSMEENLHDGEYILWQVNAYEKSSPARGDVVVVEYPGDPNRKRYVKRVVGTPGDTVELADGKLYINKALLKESYLSDEIMTEPDGTWNLEGRYFVLGDNRPNSSDSRIFGPVEQRFIVGKAVSIIFPRFRLMSDI